MTNINIESIIQNLKTLSLLDLNTLIKEIESSFAIQTSAFTSNINSSNTAPILGMPSEIKEEKSVFTVTLTSVPQDKKISVLKIVRTITGFGLKESKDIVDNLPKILKENISKEESEKIKHEIETVGGTILID